MNRIILISLVVSSFLFSQNSKAQSFKDLFNKDTVSKVTGSILGNKLDVVGTWRYSGSAVDLQSDNAIKKAGSALISGTLENKLNEQLDKFGITDEQTQFIFKSDKTFVIKTAKKDFDGTYEVDTKNNKLLVKILGKSFDINAQQSGKNLSLLFNGDKIFQFATLLGSNSGISSLQTLTSIAKEYDGMNIGLKLSKQ